MPTIHASGKTAEITTSIHVKTIQPTTQDKIVEPKKEEQIVVPDEGVFALSSVTVEAIPEEYVIPSGTLNINAVGTYDVKNYEQAKVEIDAGVQKGLIIHSYDEDGYVTSASVVGMTTIPDYFLYNASYYSSDTKRAWMSSIGDRLTLPDNYTSIGTYAFAGNTNLILRELPESVTSIGASAFSGNKNLQLEKLPDKLVLIGSSAFYNCEKLTIKEIPSGVRSLGMTAFESCKGLTELTFTSPTFMSVDNSTFRNCTALEKVEILATTGLATQMNSFNGCSNLEKLIYRNISNISPLANINTLQGTAIANGTGYVYVPDNLVDKFKSYSNWSYYADQIKGLSELEE